MVRAQHHYQVRLFHRRPGPLPGQGIGTPSSGVVDVRTDETHNPLGRCFTIEPSLSTVLVERSVQLCGVLRVTPARQGRRPKRAGPKAEQRVLRSAPVSLVGQQKGLIQSRHKGLYLTGRKREAGAQHEARAKSIQAPCAIHERQERGQGTGHHHAAIAQPQWVLQQENLPAFPLHPPKVQGTELRQHGNPSLHNNGLGRIPERARSWISRCPGVRVFRKAF